MPGIADQLRGGNRRTLGRSKEVARLALRDPSLVGDLMKAVLEGDAVVRARAADALELVSAARPEWLLPFKALILEQMAVIDQWEVREHVCLILPRLKLTAAEARAAFEFLHDYLNDRSSIVRTFAMQAMADLSLDSPALRDEATKVIEAASASGSAAMRARARKLLAHFAQYKVAGT